ncbi:hypothetical protein BC830DRAFT_1125143 [Chytriomyces sp. MP71]|nr:hypothetical protein BC830DRAFT_1125143 [Chytriomyces sp. MP71]
MSEFTCQTEDALPHNKTNAASNSTKVRMQLLTLFNTTSVVDLSGRASNISASQTLMATSAAKLPNPSSVFNVSNTPFMSSNVSSPSALSLPPPLFSSNASVGYCQSYFASANLTATSCLSTETWWQTPCSCDATLLTTLNSLPLVCLPTLTPTDLQTLLIFLADFQAPCSGFSGVSIGCQQQLQTVLYPTNTCIQAAQTNATAMATCFCEQVVTLIPRCIE